MDDEALEYSGHARDRMTSDSLFEDDVEGVVAYPVDRERSRFGRVAHFGYTSDGRRINVVTDRSERYVITVIDVDKRRRARRRPTR